LTCRFPSPTCPNRMTRVSDPPSGRDFCTDRAGELGEFFIGSVTSSCEALRASRSPRCGVTVSPQAGAAGRVVGDGISVTPVASSMARASMSLGSWPPRPRREATHRLRGPKEREEPTPREPAHPVRVDELSASIPSTCRRRLSGKRNRHFRHRSDAGSGVLLTSARGAAQSDEGGHAKDGRTSGVRPLSQRRGSLRLSHDLGQVVSDVVLHKPRQTAGHRAVREYDFDSAEPRAHRPYRMTWTPPRWWRPAADGRRVASRDVDAQLRISRSPPQPAQPRVSYRPAR